jgi:hypothetical protein
MATWTPHAASLWVALAAPRKIPTQFSFILSFFFLLQGETFGINSRGIVFDHTKQLLPHFLFFHPPHFFFSFPRSNELEGNVSKMQRILLPTETFLNDLNVDLRCIDLLSCKCL